MTDAAPKTERLDTIIQGIMSNGEAPAPATPDYAFHPLADKFPLMDDAELKTLAEDIAARGLLHKIAIHEGKIIDGRNRYLAAKLGEVTLTSDNFREMRSCGVSDPLVFVISMNIHRRHLTAEKKRELLKELIKIDPSKSNRQIATEAGVDHKTVAVVREAAEATGEIPQSLTTTGKDGKKRKTKGKGGGGKPKVVPSKGSEKEKIEYQKVTDAISASKAYRLLEQCLLDALEDFSKFVTFDHVQQYVEDTKDALDGFNN
jgi:hypothetical protein